MTNKNVPSVTLNNNIKIPQLGFGTWKISGESECNRTIKEALEVGYRHFDTAQIYGNEKYIGKALSESNVNRSDLFITTKIWNDNMYWDSIEPSLEKSLDNLKTEYVDLLLMHFPVSELRRPAWNKMQDIYHAGKTKSIGVSNYTIQHLKELLKECEIKPAVNQVELHVFLQQPDLVKYCQDNEIALEAYSPLAHGYIKSNEILSKIADKYSKSIAQVMIRWCLDQNFITIPKASNPKHIKENFEVFDFQLDGDDLQKIEGLERNLRTCWDPTHTP